MVIRVPDRARQVLNRRPESLEGEDITDWIRALVRGAVNRVLRAGNALVVRDGGPALETMAEDVEAARGMDGGGHGAGVEGIADAEGGLEGTVGDAGFGARGGEVEDGGAGGFAAGAGGGGDGDEGLEGFVDGETFAEGGVDEVEEVGGGVADVEVHELGGVDYGATADGEEGVRLVGLGERDGFFDAVE